MTYEATATDRVLAWWNAGDTGLSSETLALELLGAFYREKDASARLWFRKMSREDDHPHDPADLGRCLRLIADVPEVRACVDRLAERNEHWRRLAPVWDELAALMEAEVGIDWRKGDRAPRTYARMREVLDGPSAGDGGEAADGGGSVAWTCTKTTA